MAGSCCRASLNDGWSHIAYEVQGWPSRPICSSHGAMFGIRHDTSRTLTVSAGDVSINDIGTRFDVRQQDHAVRAAEGKVQVCAVMPGSRLRCRLHCGPGGFGDADCRRWREGVARSGALMGLRPGRHAGAWKALKRPDQPSPIAPSSRATRRSGGRKRERSSPKVTRAAWVPTLTAATTRPPLITGTAIDRRPISSS